MPRFALALALMFLPLMGQAAEPIRLVNYAYQVQWTGATMGWAEKGEFGAVLQSDLELDQHILHLVDAEGLRAAQIVQQGYTAFVDGAGMQMEQTFDLVLANQALGVPLSLRSLVDWSQARDSIGPMDVARVKRDAKGLATQLEEDGWVVRYDSWQATGEFFVPARWTARHVSGLELTMTLVEAKAFSTKTLPATYKPISFQ